MGLPPRRLAENNRPLTSPSARSAARAADGPTLLRLFTDAEWLLKRHVTALNAINVFPVPDGDTGTNMHMTLRAGVTEMTQAATDGVAAAAGALAQGALMGARGNSGVILSQILRGLSSGLGDAQEMDGPAFARALLTASDAAYGALSEPAEGTILTVVREAGEALAQEAPESLAAALDTASTAALAAVEKTPELLPALKEAGVVDAGGLGLAVILEALRRSLHGEPLDVNLAPEVAKEQGWQSQAAALHRTEHGVSGYCTEFVISAAHLEADDTREALGKLGSSLLVVGADELLRVHLHTTRPDNALAYGRSLGKLSQVKVDNMETQIDRFATGSPPAPIVSTIDIVAIAAGEGIERAFRSVGVTQLIRGGQTMNPSAGEILEAIEACRAEQVVVLPNNKNVIAAAEQAAERATKRALVVPSRSIPQGVAAVLALSPDLTFEKNGEVMEQALDSVRSAEITRAVRETTIDGRRIELGQAIGVVDGVLSVVESDIDSAVGACVAKILSPEAGLLTLYASQDVRDQDSERLANALRERYPQLEIELIWGGQPHYAYLLSLE